MSRKVFSRLLSRLPQDLTGWEFGLDQACTHLLGWSERDRTIWTLDLFRYIESIFQIPQDKLLPGGKWLGPRMLQGLFGTVGMVQWNRDSYLFVSGEGSRISLKKVPIISQACTDRFTLSHSSLRRGQHPITLWSSGYTVQQWFLEDRGGLQVFQCVNRDREACPWLGPITQSKVLCKYPPMLEHLGWVENPIYLIPAGGLSNLRFSGAVGTSPTVLKETCIGLTRFGGGVFLFPAKDALVFADYTREGGTENTVVHIPGGTERILLAMQDAWSRLNLIVRGENGPTLEEWSLR